jgi:hypothetical protein
MLAKQHAHTTNLVFLINHRNQVSIEAGKPMVDAYHTGIARIGRIVCHLELKQETVLM